MGPKKKENDATKTSKIENKNRVSKRKQDDGWGGQGMHGYMKEKERKLEEQFLSLNDHNGEEKKSDIFNGVCIFVNGYTNPSSDHLKQIMADHGGRFQHYYSCRSCTHIIATNLPDSKIKDLKNEKIVHPDWIVESVQADRRLPIDKYRLYCKGSETKKNAFANFHSKTDNSIDRSAEKGSFSDAQMNAQQNTVSCIDDDKLFNNLGDDKGDMLMDEYDTQNESDEPYLIGSDTEILGYEANNEDDAFERSAIGREASSELKIDAECHDGGEGVVETGYDVVNYEGRGDRMKNNKTSESNQVTLPNLTKHDYTNTSPSKGMGKAGDPGFMNEFYSNSRLHHLSMWKSELKRFATMIHKASSKKVNVKTLNKKSERCIMHIDMDSFFVSVALKERPELKGKPVAVCHASKGAATAMNMTSMSEIASCSYEARSKGVRNGMFLGNARSKCPELVCVPYYFESYRTVSQKFYEILASYTSEIEAVSCDEALLDISDLIQDKLTALDLAIRIRTDVLKATGCTASAGMARNILLARMATRKAKPNGQFHLQNDDIKEFIGCQKVSDLPGVGYSLNSKLAEMGITTCAELRQVSLQYLQARFGPRTGQSLFNHCRGTDARQLKTDHERQSVSAEINYGIRFTEHHESHSFLNELANEVHERLTSIDMKGSNITLKLMVRAKGAPEPRKHMGHGLCDNISKSITISQPTNDSSVIAKEAINLLQQLNVCASDIRGMGIQVSKLVPFGSTSKAAKTIDFSRARPVNTDVTHTASINPIENIQGASGNDFQGTKKEHASKEKSAVKKKGRKPNQKSNKPAKLTGSTITNFVKRLPVSHGIKNRFQAGCSSSISEPPLPCLGFSPAKKTTHNQMTSHDLPPISEIDPTVFNELPDDVKKSISEAYKQRNQVLDLKGCSLKMPRLDLSPSSRSKRPRRKGLDWTGTVNLADGREATDCPNESAEITSRDEDILSESRIDPEVMEALPEDLRKEVLLGIKLEKRRNERQKKDAGVCITKESKNVNENDGSTKDKQDRQKHPRLKENEAENVDAENVNCIAKYAESTQSIPEAMASQLTRKQIPAIYGKTKYEEVKLLIKEWFSSTDDPLFEDREEFVKYLESLVDYKNLEQAYLLLKLFKRLSSKSLEWTRCWEELDLRFGLFVKERYGAKLCI